MHLYGLIGFPLEHSFSPQYFAEKFYRENITGTEYRLFPIENITDFILLKNRHPNLKGLNVTIPHKESIIPFMDELDAVAEAVGAVNCINLTEGKAIGYNTDVYGFEQSLTPLLQPHHEKALVLGTGGAAKAVAYVLNKLNIAFSQVSRTPAPNVLTYHDLNHQLLQEHTIIINTTPLGMHPNIYDFPDIPYRLLSARHLLFDLIYRPEKTVFLIKGEQQGAVVKNGLEMLYLQAEKSWEIWHT
jgi:shikimate dehydrogenase